MDKQVGDTTYVGQSVAMSMLATWEARDNFPHFLLIAGEIGSGRFSLAYLFARALDGQVAKITDISVDSIRSMIQAAYSVDSKIVYVICNADKMSVAAKNSLLKLTEEPPQNAYIILTLESLDNTLPTLRSRSQHIVMEPYKPEELRALTNNETISQLASNPGMVKTLEAMKPSDVDNIIDITNKLVQFVDKVSFPNALKSAKNIKFKDTDTGIDLQMLFAGLRYNLNNLLANEHPDVEILRRVSCWYRVMALYVYMFARSGVNKKALYDLMIRDVRRMLQSGGAS